MPTLDEHIVQAAHNEALSRVIEQQYADWALTALFYAALHYVEAYFYQDSASGYPRHYTNHVDRHAAVRSRLRPIYGHYRALMTHSLDARYNCVAFSASDVHSVRRGEFDQLKTYILRRIR